MVTGNRNLTPTPTLITTTISSIFSHFDSLYSCACCVTSILEPLVFFSSCATTCNGANLNWGKRVTT